MVSPSVGFERVPHEYTLLLGTLNADCALVPWIEQELDQLFQKKPSSGGPAMGCTW